MFYWNRFGYVPLLTNDPNYQEELSRQKSKNTSDCQCSNCKVEKAQLLIQNLKKINQEDFHTVIKDKMSFGSVTPMTLKRKYMAHKTTQKGPIIYSSHTVFDSLKNKMIS
jgi:hypothetical protein